MHVFSKTVRDVVVVSSEKRKSVPNTMLGINYSNSTRRTADCSASEYVKMLGPPAKERRFTNLLWLAHKLIWVTTCLLNRENVFGELHEIERWNEGQRVIGILEETRSVILNWMYSNCCWLQCQYLLLQIARVHREKRCLRCLSSREMLVSLCAQMRGLTALKLMARRNVRPARCVYFTSALICLTFLNI